MNEGDIVPPFNPQKRTGKVYRYPFELTRTKRCYRGVCAGRKGNLLLQMWEKCAYNKDIGKESYNRFSKNTPAECQLLRG